MNNIGLVPYVMRYVSKLVLIECDILDRTLALERASGIRDGALHRKATVGANREGHGRLAGWRIVGGE